MSNSQLSVNDLCYVIRSEERKWVIGRIVRVASPLQACTHPDARRFGIHQAHIVEFEGAPPPEAAGITQWWAYPGQLRRITPDEPLDEVDRARDVDVVEA